MAFLIYGFDFIRKLKSTQVVQLLYMKTLQEMLMILDIRLLEVSQFALSGRYCRYSICETSREYILEACIYEL